ncbi:DNA-binding transcriptional LysR family regulator [Kribbella orskensis]|uniref:DNA-binding transcriptional LysR family regulator n=1 Tax=Kribbella orskensis TaxID=2512216 RepID=A0ABY2BGZ6_9ACTN|nr:MULTISPECIES: LysR family transcriptional regulator [Kribbella]TCN38104.1 DNA-binding transcriptional LysR family regulator [Kribbella sp. VKM Ac-2500]TCO19591.1 DNA-binding transcriptional LysR family regulator [Kribbella orskensis]
MASSPSVEDLQLVLAISRTGSVGTAARELRISQPSASQRLARLERTCATRLFLRDTRGARPTPAGHELARRAEHILGHLEEVYDATRAAAAGRRLVVGTFVSLAPILFPVLDAELADLDLEQQVDHGQQLAAFVAEGTMDAAFIAIADQMVLPRGTVARPVGRDELVLFAPPGVAPPGKGKLPLRERDLPYSTYDRGGDEIRSRLIALGANARRGVTLGTTVAMARRRSQLALIPRSALSHELRPGERLIPAPFRYRLTLSLVTGPTAPDRLLALLPQLRESLHLTPVRKTPVRH